MGLFGAAAAFRLTLMMPSSSGYDLWEKLKEQNFLPDIGRWSVLLRMNESGPTRVKTTTLASVVLHDVCIEKGDTISSKLDLTKDLLYPSAE